MSNGSGGNNCEGATRVDGIIYLTRHDVPSGAQIQDEREMSRDQMELLAAIPASTYFARVALAKTTRIVWPNGENTADPRVVYDTPAEGEASQYAPLSAGELYAAGRYLDEGFRDEIPEDKQPHIASESLLDMPGETNPYTYMPDALPQPALGLVYANAA
jgi:hypothetical protein